VDIDDVHTFFDYSMPSRYVDANSDGIFPDTAPHVECTDADDPDSCTTIPATLAVQPANGWRVDLDACESTPGPDEITYEWRFSDTFAPVPVQQGSSPCRFFVMFPTEGTFSISLVLIGSGFSVGYQRQVVVQDFLIVALGDSAGAGEGSPNIVADDDTEPVWQDRSCHRSSRNGSARAAQLLESLDPHTSVTYLNLACSGAKTMEGLLEPYDGVDRLALEKYPEVELRKAGLIPKLPPQIQQAAVLVGDREIDALDISIMANDADFSEIVEGCALSEPCQTTSPATSAFDVAALFCLVFGPIAGFGCATVALLVIAGIEAAIGPNFTNMTAAEILDMGLNGDGTDADTCVFCGLTEGFRQLADALVREPTTAADAGRADVGLGLPATDGKRVYLTEYPDPTTKPYFDVNDPDSNICGGIEDFFVMFPGVTRTEAKWMKSEVVAGLNGGVAEAADEHGWELVDGIASSWNEHGYCADDHWTVRLDETLRDLHDVQGVLHPNRAGYDATRNEILQKWLPDLYPDDDGFGPGITGLDSEATVLDKAHNHLEFHPTPRLPAIPVVDAGGPYTVDEGSFEGLVGTATDTSDTDLDLVWSIADATPAGNANLISATGATAILQGRDDGFGHVALTATNDAGRSSSAPAFYLVENVAPTVGAGANASVAEGSTFTRTVTLTDPGTLDTHSVTVDWGDGTSSSLASASPPSFDISHVYADNGTYAVDVCATDDDLGSDCGSFSVTVANATPSVSVAPAGANEGAVVTLPATSFNDPGTRDTHTATVAWGDGTPAQAATVTEVPTGPPGSPSGLNGTVSLPGGHVYADNGTYAVTVCVIDDDAGSTCTAGSLAVGNVAPAATITAVGEGPGFFLPLVTLPLSGTFHDAGTRDTHTATASWGDGSAPTATAVVETPFGPPGSPAGLDGTFTSTYAYSAPGVFTLTVTVHDDDGGVATPSRPVEVLSPLDAVERMETTVRALASDPAVRPAARTYLRRAITDLDGAGDAPGNSGADDKLRDGDRVAAVVKLQAAIADLEAALQADPSIVIVVRAAELVVAQIAESIATDALNRATLVVPPTDRSGQRTLASLRATLEVGRTQRVAGHYDNAVASFKIVVQGAVGLGG
jgi:hypothetical protein